MVSVCTKGWLIQKGKERKKNRERICKKKFDMLIGMWIWLSDVFESSELNPHKVNGMKIENRKT